MFSEIWQSWVGRNSSNRQTVHLKHVLMKFLKTYPKSYPINDKNPSIFKVVKKP
ncbi:hypothetical protein HMPREF3156_00667 [Neisseria sp. HMSC06F02]|nr:hypothetical protein HMPREF3156_00667 [Neisseria sp. HMSC06F02]